MQERAMALTRLFFGAAALSILITVGPAAAVRADDTTSGSAVPAGMTSAEKERFDALIRQYILDHPEVVIESLQAYQARQRAAAQQESRAALVALKDEIEKDPSAPVAGNTEGNVTIVEFFDYRCGYCKRVFPSIQQLIETDGNIRYVFKEFPVLGPESVTAARAALAVWNLQPDKYFPFHTALMQARGGLTEQRILKIAEQVGLDPARVRDGMDDPRVEETLKKNAALAGQIKINGTPAFVIDGQLIPGAIDLATINHLVEAARQS
jgi:protein-disulfide isomerase